MTTWEYKMVKTNQETIIPAQLNELGREGWELVSANCILGAIWYLIFKRPIRKVIDQT